MRFKPACIFFAKEPFIQMMLLIGDPLIRLLFYVQSGLFNSLFHMFSSLLCFPLTFAVVRM